MKPGFVIKTSIISFLLLAESFYLTRLVASYVRLGNPLVLNASFAIQTVITMVILSYTFVLSSGTWQNPIKYVVVPLPVSLAVLFAFINLNPAYAVVAFAVCYLLLCHDTHKACYLQSLLVKFDPKVIFRSAAKGLTFLFSMLAGVLVILQTSGIKEINIGAKIANVVEGPIKKLVESELQTRLQKELAPFGEASLGGLDTNTQSVLKGLGVNTSEAKPIPDLANLKDAGFNIKGIIENQVNSFVEPYKSFVQPVMAVLTFAIFQFLASIAFLIFNLTVGGVFWLARKLKLFEVQIIQVDKEILKF